MLNENGYPDHSPLEDIGTTQEKDLGKIIKRLHGTDFYSLTEFPAGVAPKFVRPFYTMLSPTDSNLTNSFDVFMRGEVSKTSCFVAGMLSSPSTAKHALLAFC
jgi:aspartyl/asparaginyl-tRNA synthetase